MELNEILSLAVGQGASDIHLKHGVMPVVRVKGHLKPLNKNGPRLTGETIANMASQIMTANHRKKFAENHEVDMGYGIEGLGRFRINIFQQRGAVGMVIRTISMKIPSLEALGLPPVVSKLTAHDRGLVLITGATGSGKSTTLAAMIEFINSTRSAHILTIEDPIEYLIKDKRSIVNQRELGLDTPSFALALKQALRQDPDIILVGEMRDRETIETALLASETGHLVFSTLHTSDATETINRILAAFEPHQQPQIRMQLAATLKAVVSQRLLTRADGTGMVPAAEVMIVNTRIREMISAPNRTSEIVKVIEESTDSFEMQTFDQSIMKLLKKGLVTVEEAKIAATNADDFMLRYGGITSDDDAKWKGFDP